MSLLYVVRHGQASFLEDNYDKLSALGETQARLLGEYWSRRKMRFDRVYSGPRARQQETARLVREVYEQAGLPWPQVVIMDEFDEYHGDTVMAAVLPALVEKNPQVAQLQQAFVNAGTPQEKHRTFQRLFEVVIGKWADGEIEVDNIESWREFSARVRQGVAGICNHRGSRAGEQVAVFTSGGPVGVAVQHALNLSSADTLRVAWMARNCSYSEFLFSGERFTLSSFNAYPHLDDPALLTYR